MSVNRLSTRNNRNAVSEQIKAENPIDLVINTTGQIGALFTVKGQTQFRALRSCCCHGGSADGGHYINWTLNGTTVTKVSDNNIYQAKELESEKLNWVRDQIAKSATLLFLVRLKIFPALISLILPKKLINLHQPVLISGTPEKIIEQQSNAIESAIQEIETSKKMGIGFGTLCHHNWAIFLKDWESPLKPIISNIQSMAWLMPKNYSKRDISKKLPPLLSMPLPKRSHLKH